MNSKHAGTSRAAASPQGLGCGVLLLLAFTALTLVQGPGTRLPCQLLPAYLQTQTTFDLLPLVTMDASFTPVLSMPYCGWPPLYGILLAPFALIGLAFEPAVIILNALVALLTGTLAFKAFKLAGIADMAGAAFLLVTLSAGVIGNLSAAFAHLLIPCASIATVVIYFDLRQRPAPVAPMRAAAAGVLAGVICGFSNWASYFNILIPTAVFLADWRVPAGDRRLSLKATVIFAGAMFGCLCACFIILLLVKQAAFAADNALIFRASMDQEKFLTRVSGPPILYLRACFYSVIRAAVVVIPIFLAAGVAWRMRWLDIKKFKLNPHAWGFAAALIAPSVVYAAIFVGESCNSGHAFYTLLWVVPGAAGLLAVRAVNHLRWLAALTGSLVLWSMTVILGWRLIPPGFWQVAELTLGQVTLRAPDLHNQVPAYAPKFTLPALIRTTARQIFTLPYGYEPEPAMARPLAAIAADLKRSQPDHDLVLIFAETFVAWDLARFLRQTVVATREDKLPELAAFFNTIKPPQRLLVVVPVGHKASTERMIGTLFDQIPYQVTETMIVR